jgi:hypothetical protein
MKLAVLALSAVAVMALAPNSFAQPTVLVSAVGSSAVFNATALAAVLPAVCGSPTSSVTSGYNIWTSKTSGSNLAYGYDGRSTSISNASGNLWVVWDTEPATKVCAYLSVDSVVGNRLFFAVPRGSLVIGAAATTTAGNNAIPSLIDASALPTDVFDALMPTSEGLAFNAAFSDIRPEDALFATTRALTALGTTVGNAKGLGYTDFTDINSAFTSTFAEVVNYGITGTDPISGEPIPAYSVQNVGGQVALILVNTTDTSAAGLGNSAFTNVNRFVLARVLAGQTTRTRDLLPSSGLPIVPLNVVLREPISGTMNTVEFCIPASKEIASSQETGVTPLDNPLDLVSADGAWRKRVIGTGEEVKQVGANADTLGYAFFSFGNVKPVVSTAKYLMVDGVDPLYSTYSGGTLPTCSAPCSGALTFPNVLNGTYPIWNIIRVITANPAPAGVNSIVSAAQTQVSLIPDFVPYSSMQVFRSHYTQSGIGAKNGHAAREIEAGGDMGGAVLTIQTDLDSITDTRKEITNEHQ